MRARDAGMDVVYEGIRLTPSQIAASALQEGVHVVGLSILSGSHRELIPSVIDALRERGVDVPVVVGGIIPEADVAPLKAAGVAAVYTPKDFDITRIMRDIVALVAERNGRRSASARVSRAPSSARGCATATCGRARRAQPGREPQRRAATRSPRCCTRSRPRALGGEAPAHVVGVTGPPGAGKSTLLSRARRAHGARAGARVAVLAVDPSSRRSGGALLGDRARIAFDPADDGVFIRSTAAGGRLGGLAPATRAAAHALAAAFDVVVIETVGVGQTETEVAEVADTVAVIVQPGSGDVLQFLKSGDHGDPRRARRDEGRPRRDRAARAARPAAPRCARSAGARRRSSPSRRSRRRSGIDELVAALDEHRAALDLARAPHCGAPRERARRLRRRARRARRARAGRPARRRRLARRSRTPALDVPALDRRAGGERA